MSLMTGQRSVDGSLAADSDDCGEEEMEGGESTRVSPIQLILILHFILYQTITDEEVFF